MTIREVLAYYKIDFNKYWEAEKYKWVAVQHFQENWNIDAEDFAGMLKGSLTVFLMNEKHRPVLAGAIKSEAGQ